MPKTVCQSVAWFKRYKPLKSVTVGRSVGSLNLRKLSYSAKTRSAFGLARTYGKTNTSLARQLIFMAIVLSGVFGRETYFLHAGVCF